MVTQPIFAINTYTVTITTSYVIRAKDRDTAEYEAQELLEADISEKSFTPDYIIEEEGEM